MNIISSYEYRLPFKNCIHCLCISFYISHSNICLCAAGCMHTPLHLVATFLPDHTEPFYYTMFYPAIVKLFIIYLCAYLVCMRGEPCSCPVNAKQFYYMSLPPHIILYLLSALCLYAHGLLHRHICVLIDCSLISSHSSLFQPIPPEHTLVATGHEQLSLIGMPLTCLYMLLLVLLVLPY